MVQVVRWYLSSYHAGRKSQVAKKPYNPILGEVFRCHWDMDAPDTPPPTSGDKVGEKNLSNAIRSVYGTVKPEVRMRLQVYPG